MAVKVAVKLVPACPTIYSGAEQRLSSESAQVLSKTLLESFSTNRCHATMPLLRPVRQTPDRIRTVWLPVLKPSFEHGSSLSL